MGQIGGYSIFRDTMADMTYPEVADAAANGAVALWGLGVIEQHGPHLPLATDVYLPAAILGAVKLRLGERGVPSVVVPPFYWGVNHVTGSFPATFCVRPEVMAELLVDVFASLKKDGFRAAFCLSGHGDVLHNRTILDAVRRGRQDGTEACMLADAALARRMGATPDDPAVAVFAGEGAPPAEFLDIHAGEDETSRMRASFPDLVRWDTARALPPTNLRLADLEEWRKGGAHALRTTPDGYFGNPAVADVEQGRQALDRMAAAIADAVIAKRPQVPTQLAGNFRTKGPPRAGPC